MIAPELPYYPRAPLEQTCLGHLGMNKAISMFAPRRRGKTCFLRNELLPAAENTGYRTVYIDLWRRQDQPELAIVEALEEVGGRRYQLASAKLKATLKAPFAEAGGEIEAKPRAATSDSDLLGRLKKAMSDLSASHDWLVVIDEFQALAAGKLTAFPAAFRTALQDRPRVKLMLTGSSRRELAQMFSSQRSPFLGMAMPVDLPELDIDFVRDRCAVIAARTGRKVPLKGLMAVFERLMRVPEYLNQVVSIIIVEGIYKPDRAYDRWREGLASGAAAKLWETLPPIERALLLLLAHHPGTPVFAEGTRNWLAKHTKLSVTLPQVQAAQRRLLRAGTIQAGQGQGAYELGDDEMRLLLAQMPAPLSPGVRRRAKSG